MADKLPTDKAQDIPGPQAEPNTGGEDLTESPVDVVKELVTGHDKTDESQKAGDASAVSDDASFDDTAESQFTVLAPAPRPRPVILGDHPAKSFPDEAVDDGKTSEPELDTISVDSRLSFPEQALGRRMVNEADRRSPSPLSVVSDTARDQEKAPMLGTGPALGTPFTAETVSSALDKGPLPDRRGGPDSMFGYTDMPRPQDIPSGPADGQDTELQSEPRLPSPAVSVVSDTDEVVGVAEPEPSAHEEGGGQDQAAPVEGADTAIGGSQAGAFHADLFNKPELENTGTAQLNATARPDAEEHMPLQQGQSRRRARRNSNASTLLDSLRSTAWSAACSTANWTYSLLPEKQTYWNIASYTGIGAAYLASLIEQGSYRWAGYCRGPIGQTIDANGNPVSLYDQKKISEGQVSTRIHEDGSFEITGLAPDRSDEGVFAAGLYGAVLDYVVSQRGARPGSEGGSGVAKSSDTRTAPTDTAASELPERLASEDLLDI